MQSEKYSERLRGFIQSAQNAALAADNQQFMPEHLLKVLIDDNQGMASGLLQRAGGDVTLIKADIERALNQLPKVTGGNGQLYLHQSLAKIFARAEELAEKSGVQACALEKSAKTAEILARGGVTAVALNQAINALRKGKQAHSASAENQYDALKKYARDLTQDAREGRLDPVIGRDEEIRRAIQVLSRRTKNNPVLIGEPGVGKTAIVEGLAFVAG